MIIAEEIPGKKRVHHTDSMEAMSEGRETMKMMMSLKTKATVTRKMNWKMLILKKVKMMILITTAMGVPGTHKARAVHATTTVTRGVWEVVMKAVAIIPAADIRVVALVE